MLCLPPFPLVGDSGCSPPRLQCLCRPHVGGERGRRPWTDEKPRASTIRDGVSSLSSRRRAAPTARAASSAAAVGRGGGGYGAATSNVDGGRGHSCCRGYRRRRAFVRPARLVGCPPSLPLVPWRWRVPPPVQRTSAYPVCHVVVCAPPAGCSPSSLATRTHARSDPDRGGPT